MYAEEDGSPWGCRGDAHACSGYLSPVGVSKFDDDVTKDDLEGFDECYGVIVVEGFIIVFA